MSSTLLRLPRRSRAPRAERPAPSPGPVLAIILACYLMIILDVSVIITALPKIHTALDFSVTGLSWVQNAYTLTFGGLLLLGARAGDILGRRRMFMVGISLFTASSLAGGLAQSDTWLLIARAVQGVGAAIAAPSTLALLMVTFREGPERGRAIAAYSSVAGAGGSVGLVLGGMLTAWASWRWGLMINVPIGIALVWLAPRYLPETERRPGQFDFTGAITSTLGMSAIVYGFVHAGEAGWGDRTTVASFLAGVSLLIAFVLTEQRAEQPITPLRLFASRQRSGAYAARVMVVSGMFSMFFFISQFLQGVSDFSALQTGLAFLPQSAVMFAMVRTVPRLATRLGDVRLLIGGVSIALTGMVWLSQVSMTTAYFPGIALPLVLLGIGMGAAFMPLTAAGIADVAPEDAGAASGLVNVAHQLGGALGLSVLAAVFAEASRSAADHPLAGATARLEDRYELAHAVSTSLTGSAIFLALGLAVIVGVMRPRRAPAVAVAPVPAASR
jgi:EmrB/QacA subfamily drug resistance transporter